MITIKIAVTLMDFLPSQETITIWLTHYGAFAFFGLLVLGIVALPVPEESMMILAGVLMHDGTLPIHTTMLAAYAGSMCGITVSYMLGRTLGIYFVHKYGGWVGITETMLIKAHNWFERFGKWTLLVGYFIPGVRHFTGFFAGTSFLDFRLFIVFAYTGAVLWVSTFLSIGYFLGNYWSEFFEDIEISADWLVILAVVAFAIYIAYLVRKANRPSK